MSVQVDVCQMHGRFCIAMNCGLPAVVLVQRDDSAALPYCVRHSDDRLRWHRDQRREITYSDAAEQLIRAARA